MWNYYINYVHNKSDVMAHLHLQAILRGTWKIHLPKYSVWRCPACERVYVFREGSNEAVKIYALEK